MRSTEPAFDVVLPRLPELSDRDISVLEDTIARQSAELNLRLTEVLELYNAQNRQVNETQIAHEEIGCLRQTISTLQGRIAQQRTDARAAQNKIADLEGETAVLRSRLDQALRESKALADRMLAIQIAFDARETNVASALEQVQYLNSELATASAERFRLVATVHGEKRRLNQQTSTLEGKLKKTEVMAATQQMQINHLQATRGKLDKRIQVLETLLKSEREIAELKIKRLSDEIERYHFSCSASNGHSRAPNALVPGMSRL